MESSALPVSSGITNKHADGLRYLSLAASFFVALSAGSNYGFSSYSPQLAERLNLTSTQTNIVGACGNMGVYLSGPFWGKLVDKKGSRIALLASAVLVSCGYGGLSLAYRGVFSSDAPIVILALFSLATGLGNNAAFTSAMNAQAKSWNEERRGLCTALVLSGFGLSAFFYSSLSHTLFPGKTGDYLLLLSIGSGISYIVGFLLIRILPQQDASSPPNARRMLSSRDLNGADEEGYRPPAAYTRRRTSSDIGGRAWAYADSQSFADEEESVTSDLENEQNGRSAPHEVAVEERQGLLTSGRSAREWPRRSSSGKGQREKNDVTGFALFTRSDFLLLFTIMTMISGTGLLFMNNIGTMTRTLYEFNKHKVGAGMLMLVFDVDVFQHGDVQQLQAHQVSAISIGNALGRILIGLLSDLLVNRSGNPSLRVYMLLLVCSLALISQGLAATRNVVTDLKKLLGISSITGLMYGTLFGLCPVLTFEWFGLPHFSQNWGIISLSPVLAGNIFNLLFGRIYDSHVPKNGPAHLCPDGEECFRSVFFVTVFAAVTASIFSLVLITRRAGRPQWMIPRS